MSEVTHKIQFPTRMIDVCGDETRYSMAHVEALPTTFKRQTQITNADFSRETVETDVPGAWLGATNGCIAAMVPAIAEAMPSRVLIPTAILPTKKAKAIPTVSLNGQWENSEGKLAKVVETGRFPKIAEVVPDILNDSREYLPLRLDTSFLVALAKALNDHRDSDELDLTLLIPIPNEDDVKAISRDGNKRQVVGTIPVVGATGIGLLMPIATGSDDRAKFATMREQYIAAREAVKE